MATNTITFSTKQDFETVLAMPTRTRRQRMDLDAAIAAAIEILHAILDEPQTILIDDGPVDPADPNGPHNSHEIPVPNPCRQRYGFDDPTDVQAMLNQFEAA